MTTALVGLGFDTKGSSEVGWESNSHLFAERALEISVVMPRVQRVDHPEQLYFQARHGGALAALDTLRLGLTLDKVRIVSQRVFAQSKVLALPNRLKDSTVIRYGSMRAVKDAKSSMS